MWAVIIIVCIFLTVGWAIWRFIWAISKPIFVYIYQKIINTLRGTGMTEQAAQAIISGVIILIILFIIWSCC